MRVLSLGLCVCALLSGCVAVPLVMLATEVAMVGGQVYSISSGGEAKFEPSAVTPDPKNLSEIKAAQSLALFPARNGTDGAEIDVFRSNTDLEVISPTKTFKWADKNISIPFENLPSSEKDEIVAKFARDIKADIALTTILYGDTQEIDMSIFVGNISISYSVVTTVYSGKTGALLWRENSKVTIRSGAAPPNDGEIFGVITKGVADRLMSIRKM